MDNLRDEIRATLRRQKVVVDYDGSDWWLMLDDGQVLVVGSPEEALDAIKRAGRRGNRTLTYTAIEWRNTPAGFVPPTGN